MKNYSTNNYLCDKLHNWFLLSTYSLFFTCLIILATSFFDVQCSSRCDFRNTCRAHSLEKVKFFACLLGISLLLGGRDVVGIDLVCGLRGGLGCCGGCTDFL